MKTLAAAGLLMVAGTAGAEVSLRYLGPYGDSYGMISDDASVIASGQYRWDNLVASQIPYAGVGYGTHALALSGDGITLAVGSFLQWGYAYHLQIGQPPTQVGASSGPFDECGDGPYLGTAFSLASTDGQVFVASVLYRASDWVTCGYTSGGRERAVLWNRSLNQTELLFVPDGLPGVPAAPASTRYRIRATGLSGDGTKVCGNLCTEYGQENRAYIWTEQAGVQFPFEGETTYASAMSSDGLAVVGYSSSNGGTTGGTALWVEGYPVQWLNLAPGAAGFDQFTLKAVSNGGHIVVGSAREIATGRLEAVYWDAGGMHLVRDVAAASASGEWCGYNFSSATDVTPDGSTILGYQIHDNYVRSNWVLRLFGPPLPVTQPFRTVGDTNSDHHVNGADLSALLSSFGSTVTPGATPDLNCDGLINAADLSVLLGAFGS